MESLTIDDCQMRALPAGQIQPAGARDLLFQSSIGNEQVVNQENPWT